MANEGYKIQLSLTLPPAAQYQPSPMLNIRADDPVEFDSAIESLQSNAKVAAFFEGYAISEAMVVLDAKPMAPVEVVKAVKPEDGAPIPGQEKCPQCGEGNLEFREGVNKAGKNWAGTFCSVKDCDYVKWGRE